MDKKIKIILWCVSVFFLIAFLVYFPAISSFLSLLASIVCLPVAKWQKFTGTFMNRKLKVITASFLAMAAIMSSPNTAKNEQTPEALPSETESTLTEATESSDIPFDYETSESPSESEKETEPAEETKAETTAEVTETTKAETEKPTETTAVHVHSWKSADCTSPKTCSVCGTAEGGALGHSWKSADCTSPKTCSVCGTAEGSALGHSWKSADCTSPKTCSVCGAAEGSALGHSWASATYTSPKKCVNCGVTEGSPMTVPNQENYHGHVYTGGSSSKKYHYEAHCAGKNSHEITWDEVERRNLGPCGTCVLK